MSSNRINYLVSRGNSKVTHTHTNLSLKPRVCLSIYDLLVDTRHVKFKNDSGIYQRCTLITSYDMCCAKLNKFSIVKLMVTGPHREKFGVNKKALNNWIRLSQNCVKRINELKIYYSRNSAHKQSLRENCPYLEILGLRSEVWQRLSTI